MPPWNPLLDLHRHRGGRASDRDEAIARYGFAVPTDESVAAIADCSPAGVIEIGAGTGYWAELLRDHGVDVIAYDIDPPPSPTNKWFAGTAPWHPVAVGAEDVVSQFPERTLLLVWPTRNETWPADAIELFHQAGGTRLVYIGEGPGGRSGDDRFHALLGTIDHCYACRYNLSDAICTCDTPTLWVKTKSIEIPQWEAFDDRLHVYQAIRPTGRLRRRPLRTRWAIRRR